MSMLWRCSVTPTLRNMWLSELWKPCPELPAYERAAKRLADRELQREMEDREAGQAIHRGVDISPDMSTGCAQNGAPRRAS